MEKKYEVIHFFTDLRDYDHAYNVGDEFPRQGVSVSDERLAELSGNGNRQGKPLIRLVSGTDNQKSEDEQDPPAQKEDSEQQPQEPEQPENPEQQPEVPGQDAAPDTLGDVHKYTKEEIEGLKLPEIRDIANKLGFKISSTSRDGAVTEFLEKQG